MFFKCAGLVEPLSHINVQSTSRMNDTHCFLEKGAIFSLPCLEAAAALFLIDGMREVEEMGRREEGEDDLSKASLDAVGEDFRGSLEYMVNGVVICVCVERAYVCGGSKGISEETSQEVQVYIRFDRL